jgi:two-component system nitrogen regulation sensor histidine kinase NtrY
MLSIDRRLVTQAVTNLVKNAREAIEVRHKDDPHSKGVIKVEIDETPSQVCINVTDNGVGLPVENRHRLTEPYMTTRDKGTGLGLAIVKRIMEEHGGRLVLQDAPSNGEKRRGALARLVFNREIVTAEMQHPAAGN